MLFAELAALQRMTVFISLHKSYKAPAFDDVRGAYLAWDSSQQPVLWNFTDWPEAISELESRIAAAKKQDEIYRKARIVELEAQLQLLKREEAGKNE